jgi:hypothetical protein
MRRTNLVPWAIFIFVVVMTAIGVRIYWNPEQSRETQVERILHQPSSIYARLLISYAKPPIYEEEYRMQDVEGVSAFTYRIRGYDGHQVTLTAPPHMTTDVSFFFGKLVHDGVWDLVDKPPRGNTDVHYIIYIKQVADFKQGDRTIMFTDPHYWATTAGRQFAIDLSKTNPNDLLKLKSTQLADPRYEQIVNDFRAFGPDAFRSKIAALRKLIEEGKS